jgi:hypothetical protein
LKDSLLHIIETIPEGYRTVLFEGKKYGLTKTTFTNGKSYKIYAEELQGTDFVSLNYYLTTTSELLKPCEMLAEKVTRFLKEMELL